MKKSLIFLVVFFLFSDVANAQDYWVYVRLEDRSGVTKSDDAGRSKRGDVVDVRPVNVQNIPSEKEKKEWKIFKATLTDTQVSSMLEEWEDKAYRKNKIDVISIGDKKGLESTSVIAPSKIQMSAKTTLDISRYEQRRRIYLVKRLFTRLANKIVPFAYAETVSTINKSGEDYNTLTLWEDAKDGDLAGDNRQETAECYDDDGTLEDYLIVDGSTTDSSYYMKVTVASGDRHDGTAGTGFLLNDNGQKNGISIRDEYTVIEWVEMDEITTGNYQTSVYIYIIAGGDYSTIRNCLIHGSDDSFATSVEKGIRLIDNGGTLDGIEIYNNVIYDLGGHDGVGLDCQDEDVDAYNNTIDNIVGTNTGYGFKDVGGNCFIKFKNNSATRTDDADFQNFGTPSGYEYSNNMDEDGTAPGTSAQSSITPSDQFESLVGGSEDYHLKSGADAIDNGTSISGIFTNDIDDDTRSGDWDIGADEYVSVTPAEEYPFKSISRGILQGVM